MPAEKELEIKLAVPDLNIFGRILSDSAINLMQTKEGPITRQFEALYFDTVDFSLQKAGIAYRIRREGDEWVATIKSDNGSKGALFNREEVNEKITSPEPSVKYFVGTHLGDRLIRVLGDARLQLLFTTKFDRTTLMLRTGASSVVEMALDHGTIWSGAVGSPILELELELKEGSVPDLMNLAGELASQFHIHPEPLSKYARGLALLDCGQTMQPVHWSSKSQFTPAGLLLLCVKDIFASQSDSIKQQCTPNTIRALRIHIRRLRSLLKFFEPLLQKEGFKTHTEKLRQWGDLLGKIRDLDVLTAAWHEFSSLCNTLPDHANNWIDIITERRGFLSATVLYTLEQGELTRCLFELQGWLLQEKDSDQEMSNLVSETETHVQKMLTTAVKDLRSEIAAINGIPKIRQLHVLRIRIKRMRYLLEALSVVSCFHDDAFIASTKKLQTLIGKIHDVYQIKGLLKKIETGEGESTLLFHQELFLGWRSRDALRHFFSLPGAFEEVRKTAKIFLRMLSTLRRGRQTKPGHNTDAHEPE